MTERGATAPGRRHAPSIDWWITSRCTLKCDFCYGPIPERLESREVRLRSLDAIRNSEASVVTLCGGEPLVLPGLPLVTRALHESRKRIILNTNGELLHGERANGLRSQAAIQTIGISIDGPDERTHQAMRGAGAKFHRSIEAARLVSGWTEVSLKIATVVSAVNKESLARMVEIVSDLKPRVWRLHQYVQRGPRISERHLISTAEFREIGQRLSERLEGTGVRIVAASGDDSRGCFILDHRGFAIEPEEGGYHILGSILDNPLDELWRRCRDKGAVVTNKAWQRLTVTDL